MKILIAYQDLRACFGHCGSFHTTFPPDKEALLYFQRVLGSLLPTPPTPQKRNLDGNIWHNLRSRLKIFSKLVLVSFTVAFLSTLTVKVWMRHVATHYTQL